MEGSLRSGRSGFGAGTEVVPPTLKRVARSLAGLDICAVFIDGIHFGEHDISGAPHDAPQQAGLRRPGSRHQAGAVTQAHAGRFNRVVRALRSACVATRPRLGCVSSTRAIYRELMAGIRRSATGTRTSGRALELTAFYSFVRRARCGARLAAVSADSASQFSFFHALFTSARLSHEPTEAVLADLSRDRLSNTTTETREDSMDQPGPRRTASSDFLCSPPRAEDQTSRVTWSPAELEALLQDVEDGSEAFRSRATTKSFVALTTRPLPGQSEDVAVRDDDDAECSCLTGLALREASLPCSVGTLTIGERRLAEGGSRLFAVIRGAESPSFSPGKVRKALEIGRAHV